MPKYWGKQIFTHGRFPEVGQKQKTEKKKEKERKKERLNNGDNNGHSLSLSPNIIYLFYSYYSFGVINIVNGCLENQLNWFFF